MAIRSRAWVFFAALIVGPFLYGYWTHQTVNVPESAQEKGVALITEVGSLDFGEQPPHKDFSWSLPLTNTTNRQLEVLDFELGCQCTSIRPSSFSIAPHETVRVSVKIDLQPRNDDELTAQVREFAASVRPIFKGGWPQQKEWQLTGRVINPYLVEPAYATYEDDLVQGTPFSDKVISVSSRHALSALQVDCQPPLADVQVVPSSDSEGKFAIRFTPNEDLPIGRHEFTLHITGTDEKGVELSPTGTKVFGNVVHDVEVLPSMIHLGAISVGRIVDKTFALRSRTGRKFQVTDVHVNREELTFDEEFIGDSQPSHKVRLECKIAKQGAQFIRVGFDVMSDVTGRLHTLQILVCYSGLSEDTIGSDEVRTSGKEPMSR